MMSRGAEPAPVVTAAIRAAVQAEREAVAAGDIGRCLGVLTEDAAFMPPNSTEQTGGELHAWLSSFLKGARVEWLSFASTEVQLLGSAAYHSFTYSWRVSPRAGGGEAKVTTGKGVHLLQLQVDGTWKISREIWNSTPSRQ